MTISAEEIQQLRSRFALKAHSIRQGNSNKAKTKSQWFVYLDKIAIIDRLDEVFPGEWEYKMTEPQLRATHYSAIGSLTIRGVTREFNGTQSLGGFNPENDEKGCGTDVFRRAASMWGIGSYINDAPNMWTAFPAKGDWDAQRKYEGEAKDMFNRWFNGSAPPAPQHPTAPNGTRQAPTVTTWTPARINDLFAYWIKQGLSEPDIIRFAGIDEKYSEQWAKYASNQDASGAIKRAFEAEMDARAEHGDLSPSDMPDSADRPAVYACKFTHMAYVVNGSSKYLNFANCDPSEDGCLEAVTMIRAYGRTTKVKEWLGEYAYKELNLDKYTGVKKTHGFTVMPIPVEFEYAQETPENGEPYLKAIGVVGSDPSF